MVAVPDEFCTFTVAVDLLPQLIESGVVEEITASVYASTMVTLDA
jgi:hypothetical protein